LDEVTGFLNDRLHGRLPAAQCNPRRGPAKTFCHSLANSTKAATQLRGSARSRRGDDEGITIEASSSSSRGIVERGSRKACDGRDVVKRDQSGVLNDLTHSFWGTVQRWRGAGSD